jgi:hypothetical protein
MFSTSSMYRKFDVTVNLFLHSALFNGTKHSLVLPVPLALVHTT